MVWYDIIKLKNIIQIYKWGIEINWIKISICNLLTASGNIKESWGIGITELPLIKLLTRDFSFYRSYFFVILSCDCLLLLSCRLLHHSRKSIRNILVWIFIVNFIRTWIHTKRWIVLLIFKRLAPFLHRALSYQNRQRTLCKLFIMYYSSSFEWYTFSGCLLRLTSISYSIQGLRRDQKSGGAKLWWDLSQTLQRI